MNIPTKFKFGPIQTLWLESLENNPERQTTHKLGVKSEDGLSYKACCLGEYGLIAGKCKWVGNRLQDGAYFGTLVESNLDLGLRSSAGTPKNIKHGSLANLNDHQGKTWPEIAAIIRANPEEYLTKSI